MQLIMFVSLYFIFILTKIIFINLRNGQNISTNYSRTIYFIQNFILVKIHYGNLGLCG